MAFHQPKALQDERTELLSRMGMLPVVSDALERGKKMLKELELIDSRDKAETSGN